MKTIILFRHSESGWNTNYRGDHERSLTERGIIIAKKMGLYLSEIKSTPDLLISSTALRAKTTAKLAKKEGGWSCKLILEKGIYGGNPLFIIDLIKKQDDAINSICLTGHEPHFSSFICRVINKDHIHFPTASMAKIDFMQNKWKDVDFDNANLDWLIKPEGLGI